MTNVSTTQSSTSRQPEFLRGEPARQSPRGQPREAPLHESAVSGRDVTEQATRLAGRLNASKATDKERNALLAERQKLLDKHFDKTITRKEAVRLEYVRWSLDRIEDARHGLALDRLEAQVEEFQRLAARLKGLQNSLGQVANKRR